VNRRQILKGAGVLTVAVAGGVVWRTYDQGVFSVGEGVAYDPWHNWRSEASEGPLALVRAGILAANPHNTQPWLFKVTADTVELHADVSRNLGTFDPFLREMMFGLGCALENMALAAAANGYSADVVLSPGSLSDSRRAEPLLVATINVQKAVTEKSALYDAIALRHTHRGVYADRALEEAVLSGIQQVMSTDPEIKLFSFTSNSEKERFSRATLDATDAIIADAEMMHDSHKWFRYDWNAIEKFRDGPTLDAAGLPPTIARIAKILPAPSAQKTHQHWRNATADVHLATAQMFGVIGVRDRYDLSQTLRAGRLWQRLHLWATTQSVAMQPLNQMMEMVDRQLQTQQAPQAERVLNELTGSGDWQATFAFRAGYANETANLSPRRAIQSVLI
jgi:hypothetical protein